MLIISTAEVITPKKALNFGLAFLCAKIFCTMLGCLVMYST